MTTKGKTSELSLEDATVALINSDPDLRAELRELIRDATARYRHVIRWGSPDARLAAIKAIVPGMLRAMGRVEQSEQEAEMRKAYERLLNPQVAILSHAPGDEPTPELPDVPADAPPKKPAARAKTKKATAT